MGDAAPSPRSAPCAARAPRLRKMVPRRPMTAPTQKLALDRATLSVAISTRRPPRARPISFAHNLIPHRFVQPPCRPFAPAPRLLMILVARPTLRRLISLNAFALALLMGGCGKSEGT